MINFLYILLISIAPFIFSCNKDAALNSGTSIHSKLQDVRDWKGKYYFEARNKDGLKTSFDISILGLNNIAVKYIQDDNAPEVYKNLKGEQISADKIRIVFNEKYNELGDIYLEKSGKSYFISGQAIYFINPGNDSYPIEKR